MNRPNYLPRSSPSGADVRPGRLDQLDEASIKSSVNIVNLTQDYPEYKVNINNLSGKLYYFGGSQNYLGTPDSSSVWSLDVACLGRKICQGAASVAQCACPAAPAGCYCRPRR